MKKWIFFTSVLLSVPLTYAEIRPVISVAAGVERMRISTNQNITLISPFQNNYSGSQQNQRWDAGLFLGLEKNLSQQFIGQLGVSYYQNGNMHTNGMVTQFLEPQMTNLIYQYQVNTQRLLLEGKLLTTFYTRYHPYVTAGLGEAFNKAYRYQEQPLSSDSLPMVPGFGDRHTQSFTTTAGLGVDVDLNSSFRLGGMYRLATLKDVSLGTIPFQDSTTTLSHPRLRGNEFLLQLSYLG